MREGYTALVDRETNLEICGATGSVQEARQTIPDLDPDLVIVDLSLEDGSGLELIKDLRAQSEALRILVVSMHDEALYAQRALDAGAEGYLAKQEPTGRLLTAIRRILDGRTYFSEEINEQMLLRYLDHSSGTGASLLQSLSDREL